MECHQVPEFDTFSSSLDDNPLAGFRIQPTRKVSANLPGYEWLCKKLQKLNIIISEGYPSKNSETSGVLKDQFVKHQEAPSVTTCTLGPSTKILSVDGKDLPGTRV